MREYFCVVERDFSECVRMCVQRNILYRESFKIRVCQGVQRKRLQTGEPETLDDVGKDFWLRYDFFSGCTGVCFCHACSSLPPESPEVAVHMPLCVWHGCVRGKRLMGGGKAGTSERCRDRTVEARQPERCVWKFGGAERSSSTSSAWIFNDQRPRRGPEIPPLCALHILLPLLHSNKEDGASCLCHVCGKHQGEYKEESRGTEPKVKDLSEDLLRTRIGNAQIKMFHAY